jgi:hypothetical protein
MVTKWCAIQNNTANLYRRKLSPANSSERLIFRAGQPPLPTRLIAGLLIHKQVHNLSDTRDAVG